MKRIIMAACIVSLAACGGDKDDVATEQQQDWESQKQSLVYSFPDNNQQEVPVPSPVVLRFSSPVAETAPAITLREAGGPVVTDVELEWVDGKRGLIITPDSKLKPLTDYIVQVPAIELEKGTAAARTLHFTTRALFEGPKSQVAADTFEVTRMIPDGENYAVMDFSSFRVQFSQPLDQNTVKYGDSAEATVQLMGPEGLVDAHLLVSGHYMTVDPKEDLEPGNEYFLNLTTGITSTYGESLPGGSFGNPGDTLAISLKAAPQDTTSPTTGERVAMVQDVADSGELSPLTGMPINLVPMASVLLGEDTATQAAGTLAAELAFVPNFPEATPFRVKRGSLIEGASIDVLIGGEVPAGFESGKVRMDFLSDASGYLLPNPYSNADDAPRQVRLFMDVSVSTETPQANGAITQNLLHIELVGTSIVENGQMVINAVGVVEPDVLGAERATGILSFYMKAFEDQDNPPQLAVDTTPPVIQSWIPGDSLDGFGEADPVVVHFNEPVDLSSENLIVIEENGVPIDIDVYTRGSALVIKPRAGFKHSIQSTSDMMLVQPYVYTVTLKQGIRDIAGNTMISDSVYQFELPTLITRADSYSVPAGSATEVYLGEVDTVTRSPMITAVYPGFPCVLDAGAIDLSQGMTSRCKGTLSQPYAKALSDDGATSYNVPDKLPDDILPLTSLPVDRPIIAVFTKSIDEQSVQLGGSFQVQKVDANGNPLEDIDGRLDVDGKKITFYPSESWSPGDYYRYVLGSNGDRHSSVANCDGTESICGEDGLPIQTQLHEINVSRPLQMDLITQDHNAENGGGDPLVQYFVGSEPSKYVVQVLNAPSVDANANMVHEHNTPNELPTAHSQIRDPYNVYAIEEVGAENQPADPNACFPGDEGCQDPSGLVAPPNSAKLLGEAYIDDGVSNPWRPFSIPLVSVGCGFETIVNGSPRMQKSVCPESKFTYLTSDLVTEVGEYDESLGGIEVKIWPGQIMSTALSLYAAMEACGGCEMVLDSGPQVMRMRYGKSDDACEEDPVAGTSCLRDQPITAVIKNVGGTPRISANVDVYIDAIDLQRRTTSIAVVLLGVPGIAETLHDIVSVPVTLNLEGEVHFNDDGTMQIGMVNMNEVKFGFGLKLYSQMFNIEAPLAYTYMTIPELGSNISYISEIIK